MPQNLARHNVAEVTSEDQSFSESKDINGVETNNYCLSYLSNEKLQAILSFLFNSKYYSKFYNQLTSEIEILQDDIKVAIDSLLSNSSYKEQVTLILKKLHPFLRPCPAGEELNALIELFNEAHQKSSLLNGYFLTASDLASFRLINTKSELMSQCKKAMDYAQNIYRAADVIGDILKELELLLGDKYPDYLTPNLKKL